MVIFRLFTEDGFNLKLGMDATSSFSFKPYLGANISVDYSWESGFGFGAWFPPATYIPADDDSATNSNTPMGCIAIDPST